MGEQKLVDETDEGDSDEEGLSRLTQRIPCHSAVTGMVWWVTSTLNVRISGTRDFLRIFQEKSHLTRPLFHPTISYNPQ